MQKYTLRCITLVTFPGQQRCSFVLAISVPSSATDATRKINFLHFFWDLLTWGHKKPGCGLKPHVSQTNQECHDGSYSLWQFAKANRLMLAKKSFLPGYKHLFQSHLSLRFPKVPITTAWKALLSLSFTCSHVFAVWVELLFCREQCPGALFCESHYSSHLFLSANQGIPGPVIL